jgi:predicted transcriptional regulator
MKTVVFDVAPIEESLAAFSRAWKTGQPDREARVSFATPEVLWKTLTAKRWGLLKALSGVGPISIREAARRVGRDVKAVHGDVKALLDAGVLRRATRGIEFPYDAVHVDFTLKAGAEDRGQKTGDRRRRTEDRTSLRSLRDLFSVKPLPIPPLVRGGSHVSPLPDKGGAGGGLMSRDWLSSDSTRRHEGTKEFSRDFVPSCEPK